jgi:transcriptional regulator with XRE-family HTH domain
MLECCSPSNILAYFERRPLLLNVGKRLRQIRREQGLSLRELAGRIGKSESYLSRVERGQLDLTLSLLKTIADQLGRPILGLLNDRLTETVGLIAKGSHKQLAISAELQYDILSKANNELSLFRMTLKPGGNSGPFPYSHNGIEAGILLQGSVRVLVGDCEYVLKEGDSLTYSSTEPHWFENIGDVDAVAIWVVSPSTF